jgi:GT2 family glycosyltransferase
MRAAARASIVVPVHNRAGLTKRCLDRVLSDLPADSEVIVVDDASSDETPECLDRYGEAIQVVRLPQNRGYGGACNAGADLARGDNLVFLNNDTEPEPGWLGALLCYSEAHPEAVAVGAKLLYPTGAVQHAGIAFGQDGYPHNLYVGFPGDHPAVNHSRRLQAVTGACLMVRREAFERVEGFDGGFLNSMEDVDLCLRLGEAGDQVHYCPDASVVHLESATRGQDGKFDRSVALYRERWRNRVRRDDLSVFAEDRLLEVEYPDSYPLSVSISPLLASVREGQREAELERLLATYGRHVADLLREVVRLTAELVDRGAEVELPRLPAASEGVPQGSAEDHAELLAAVRQAETEARRLRIGGRLGYPDLVEQIREEVDRSVPEGATVLVVSRGDRELLRLDGRLARHFPEGPAGEYLGHHPNDDAQAIAMLEEQRGAGADYLLVPETAGWWLEHYAGFADHLRSRYAGADHGSCAIFHLDERQAGIEAPR